MIYLLIGILFVLLVGCIIHNKDIFAPECILCESYILAVAGAIINNDVWEIDLKAKTVYIIILGTIVFIIISLFTKHILLLKEEKKVKNINKINTISTISIQTVNILIMQGIQFIILVLYFIYFSKAVGGIRNFLDFSSVMNYYRMNTSYGVGLEENIPSIINQMTKISTAFSYISLYIFVHNAIVNKKNAMKKIYEKKYIISFILYIPLIILSGGRSELIIFMIAAIMMYYILDRTYNDYYNIKLKKVLKICFSIVVIIFIFSITRTLVGRTNEASFIDYVSQYFGGSIKLFDMYLENPIPKSDIVGKETFYGLNKFLYQIGVLDQSYKIHLEFREVNGMVLGNVYTAYRRMIQDFGVIGIITLQTLTAIFMRIYYESVKKEKFRNTINLSVILYCIISHVLFLHSYSEYLFNSIISINYFLIIICLIIVKFFLTKVKI